MACKERASIVPLRREAGERRVPSKYYFDGDPVGTRRDSDG